MLPLIQRSMRTLFVLAILIWVSMAFVSKLMDNGSTFKLVMRAPIGEMQSLDDDLDPPGLDGVSLDVYFVACVLSFTLACLFTIKAFFSIFPLSLSAHVADARAPPLF